jgi:hypothetical protein
MGRGVNPGPLTVAGAAQAGAAQRVAPQPFLIPVELPRPEGRGEHQRAE